MKRSPTEGRYSRVSRRMWGDEKFRRLSAPKPNAQTLWQRLLTGPELGCIPGLFEAREAGLADALGWTLAAFRKCWKEIADQRMAFADWSAGLVWLPQGIVHDPPASPNVVKSWRLAWLELPESELKDQARARIESHLAEMGDAWVKAFSEASGKPSGKPSRKPSRKASDKPPPHPSRNQIQIQIQDQDPKAAEDPPDLIRRASGAASSEQQQRRPANRAEALGLPASERAQLVIANPHDGEFLEPQRWPEVEAVAAALAEACKHRPPRLGSYQRDAGVRSVVGLLADGFSPEELVRVARSLPKTEWWQAAKRGLASLTPEVVRRELDAATNAPKLVDVTTNDVVARAERAAARAARAAAGASGG